MNKALDVAKYFITKDYEENYRSVTQKKVQKLVYYAQAWSLVFLDKPLFKDELQAWVHGSVAIGVRDEYRRYKSYCLPKPTDFKASWTSEERKVLDEVWRVYGSLSADKLEELNHKEMPWQNARVGLLVKAQSQEPILHEDMKYYYSHYKSSEPFAISDLALDINKKITTFVEMANGESIEVNVDELEEFLVKNRGLLKERKRNTRRKPIEVAQ